MKNPIQLLIVDDHTIVRQSLRAYLALDSDLHVVGEAGSGEEAINLCKQLRPDVVLMDLLMPGIGGVSATQTIRRENPDCEVVALTSVLDEVAVVSAVKAGAIGYILKTTDLEGLRQVVKAAAAGQVQLSPEAAARLLQEVRLPEATGPLTDRETDVLQRLAQGKANKEIAHELAVGEQTVKAHVSHILSKLHLQSRTQAALYARQVGLLPDFREVVP